MVRSIPEKTLEHWASMYVAHRFPRGGLWWPTHGEDIRVEDLGTLPGKSVFLETKVPEQEATGTHVVTVDVPQLRRYTTSLVPVYYVFPQPPWPGDLVTSGWLGNERRADLAYKRARNRWFGEWTFVCRATDLLAHLAPSRTQKTATLATLPPTHWRWFDFWTELAECGSPALSTAFVLPSSDVATELAEGDGTITRTELREKLSSLRSALMQRGNDERRHRKHEERERYVEQLRSSNKAVLVPLVQPDSTDLYRAVSAEELRASFDVTMPAEETGVASADEVENTHLSISAVPFSALIS